MSSLEVSKETPKSVKRAIMVSKKIHCSTSNQKKEQYGLTLKIKEWLKEVFSSIDLQSKMPKYARTTS